METSEPFLQNLLMRKKEMTIGSISIFAGVALLISYFQSGPNAFSYAKAEKAVSLWDASPADSALYLSMREALKKVPAIQNKYEAAIAQKLIHAEKVDEALSFAKASLQRVKHEIPLHVEYGETSLLIEQGKFQEALEKAVALKEKMNAPSDLLYGYNLVRIACLQQALKNWPGEKAAWAEVESFLQAKHDPATLLLSVFKEKQIDLNRYISNRVLRQ